MESINLSKILKNVKIDESKIRSELLKNNKQNEYLLSEIVFNIQKKDELNKNKFNLDDIKTNGFEKAVFEYSISDSSKWWENWLAKRNVFISKN